jgi:hypothetical protein
VHIALLNTNGRVHLFKHDREDTSPCRCQPHTVTLKHSGNVVLEVMPTKISLTTALRRQHFANSLCRDDEFCEAL